MIYYKSINNYEVTFMYKELAGKAQELVEVYTEDFGTLNSLNSDEGWKTTFSPVNFTKVRTKGLRQ